MFKNTADKDTFEKKGNAAATGGLILLVRTFGVDIYEAISTYMEQLEVIVTILAIDGSSAGTDMCDHWLITCLLDSV